MDWNDVHRFACWREGECVAWTNLRSMVRDGEAADIGEAARLFAAHCVEWYGDNLTFYWGSQADATPSGAQFVPLSDLWRVVMLTPADTPVLVIEKGRKVTKIWNDGRE